MKTLPSDRFRSSGAGRVLFSSLGLSCWLVTALPLGAQDTAAESRDLRECESEIEEIRKLYKTIPVDFRDLREPLDVVAERVTTCKDRLEKFLSYCDTQVREKKIASCDAYFMLARLNTSLAARVRSGLMRQQVPPQEISRRMEEYHRANVVLCDRSFACKGEVGADEKSSLEMIALDLRGDIRFSLREYREALADYLKVVDKYPEYDDIGNTIVGAGRAFAEIRDITGGIQFMQKAIRERYRDPSLPVFYEALWNLLMIKGDHDPLLKWCEDVQAIFPLRQEREGIRKTESDGYRRYLGFSGFRRGYILFAKGDLSGAVDAFTKHIAEMDRWQAELEKSKQQLPQELKIYQGRSRDVLNAIQNRVGDPARMELDLEDLWVSDRRVLLGENRGKAVGVLFRSYGDKRSRGFLQNLDRHLSGKTDRLAMAAIHYLKGSSDPLGQLTQLADEMAELEIENVAAGMDPDARGKTIFRSNGAMVGSATFMIFDRQGRLMWWMQDPRRMDSQFVINIWERLARE